MPAVGVPHMAQNLGLLPVCACACGAAGTLVVVVVVTLAGACDEWLGDEYDVVFE